MEIWIPEILIVLFLLLPNIRLRREKLSVQRGLAWLPVAAGLLAAGLFPAYGFRPEALLLVVFALIAAGGSVLGRVLPPSKARSAGGASIFTLLMTVLGYLALLGALALACWFAPRGPEDPRSGGDYALRLENGTSVLELRLYAGPSRESPLLIVTPPAFGARALDGVCLTLRDQGFTVLTAVQAPASPAEWFRRFRALTAGTRSVAAAAAGAALETARTEEILFILRQITRNPELAPVEEGAFFPSAFALGTFPGGTAGGDAAPGSAVPSGPVRLFDLAAETAIFLWGYDAGASALALLAADATFQAAYPAVRGIIAVESSFWSLYEVEPRQTEPAAADASWFAAFRAGALRWLESLKPRKLAGLGPVPGAKLPTLFLVSGRALEPEGRTGPYRGAYAALLAAEGPAVLAACDEAGPLDYADFPAVYPLISRFLPGRGERSREPAPWEPGASVPVQAAARLAATFAASLLEGDGAAGDSLVVSPLAPGFHIETRSWNLQGRRFILEP